MHEVIGRPIVGTNIIDTRKNIICDVVSNVNKQQNRSRSSCKATASVMKFTELDLVYINNVSLVSAAVYEQYARPKSRRSSVPMSGVEITERPRTSRGRRSHEQERTEAELERPMSRRGYAPVEGTERPATRHGRKDVSDSMQERPVTRHGIQPDEDFNERPSTRHGRSQSESSQEPREGSRNHVDVLNLDGVPAPTPTPPPKPNVRMRPKSAKGRVRSKPAPRPSKDRGIIVFCFPQLFFFTYCNVSNR